jgi:hypothetical protein
MKFWYANLCFLILVRCENFLWQILHSNGFSPEIKKNYFKHIKDDWFLSFASHLYEFAYVSPCHKIGQTAYCKTYIYEVYPTNVFGNVLPDLFLLHTVLDKPHKCVFLQYVFSHVLPMNTTGEMSKLKEIKRYVITSIGNKINLWLWNIKKVKHLNQFTMLDIRYEVH